MTVVEDYIKDWDSKWNQAGKMLESLKDQKYLRTLLEEKYSFTESVSGKKCEIPLKDKRVQQIFNFLQTEISKSDLNRRNFALQLLGLPEYSKNGKIACYFNHGCGFDGATGGMGFDVDDAFDATGTLTDIGREALRHEGPMGHGAQVERASLLKYINRAAHQNPLFNDVQGALISNLTEAKAMTAQCIANFEAGEPIGINSYKFADSLAKVLKDNNLSEQELHDLSKTDPKQYNHLISEIKKQQFIYMAIHRANIGGYQTQTLVFMNFHGKGSRNTPLFKKLFECECRSLGLDSKDTAEMWTQMEPYATGKSIPGFEGCFNDAGNLRVADRNAVKAGAGMRGLKAKLLSPGKTVSDKITPKTSNVTSPPKKQQPTVTKPVHLREKIYSSIKSSSQRLLEAFTGLRRK